VIPRSSELSYAEVAQAAVSGERSAVRG